jgi:hypothetical protein
MFIIMNKVNKNFYDNFSTYAFLHYNLQLVLIKEHSVDINLQIFIKLPKQPIALTNNFIELIQFIIIAVIFTSYIVHQGILQFLITIKLLDSTS